MFCDIDLLDWIFSQSFQYKWHILSQCIVLNAVLVCRLVLLCSLVSFVKVQQWIRLINEIMNLNSWMVLRSNHCYCCDRKSRAAYAQSFALSQQATVEFTCHDHSPRTLVVTFNRSQVNISRASTPRSLFYCLFEPHIWMVLFFTHIPFVENYTINATPPEKLQHYQRNGLWNAWCHNRTVTRKSSIGGLHCTFVQWALTFWNLNKYHCFIVLHISIWGCRSFVSEGLNPPNHLRGDRTVWQNFSLLFNATDSEKYLGYAICQAKACNICHIFCL